MTSLGLQSAGAIFNTMNIGQKLGIGALLIKGASILKEKPKTPLSLAAVGTAIAAIIPPFNGLMLGAAAGLGVASALTPPDGHKLIGEYMDAVHELQETNDKLIKDLRQKNNALDQAEKCIASGNELQETSDKLIKDLRQKNNALNIQVKKAKEKYKKL